jgi:protein AIR1/2
VKLTVPRTAQTDILEACRINTTIVIAVDQMRIRQTCVIISSRQLLILELWIKECPTIWRLYEYVTDPEREAILRSRESKQSLGLGKGGEGYIASDEWCYNCGNYGHLGDVSSRQMCLPCVNCPRLITALKQDCGELPHPHDKPSAPSAFGLYNILSGPFSDAATAATRPRAPRDWENGDTFGDGWGARAPINVGKRARNKDRLRMEQRALELREQEQDRDDSGDWFERARNTRNERSRRRDRDRDRSSSPGASTTGGGRGVRKKKDAKIRIGVGIGMAWKSSDDPPLSPHHHSHDQHDHHHQPHRHRKPTLLERVSSDNNMNDDDVVEIDVVDFHSRGHPDRFHDREQEREREDRDRDDRDYSRSRGGRERSRDRDQGPGRGQGRDARGGGGGGLRIRGSANRTRIDGSRREHSGSYEREGRRREEESRGGDRRWEDKRGRDRKYEPRTGRDNNDRIPRGPQYKGGYA